MAEGSPPLGLHEAGLPHRLRRWLPAAVLIVLVAATYGLGLHRHFSLAELAEHRVQLRGFVDSHLFLALLIFAASYVAIVALSIPGAAAMSIAGGFLFGWMLSVPVTIISAVCGSVIVFQVVRTSFGAALAERAGPLLQRLSRGFSEYAFSLLLFLRLAPIFPFWAVNAVAGLARVPLRVFILATSIGIIPASIAFALLGSGLDGVIDQHMQAYADCVAAQGGDTCRLTLEPKSLLSRQLVFAFVALGAVSLLPLAMKLFKRGRTP